MIKTQYVVNIIAILLYVGGKIFLENLKKTLDFYKKYVYNYNNRKNS
jgi:hypothetical protein